MPISSYFNGHGDEVMTRMLRQYGPKKGRRIFYATANKLAARKGASRR